MKALKYVLAASGAALVLATVVVVIAAATFDPNEYKPQIVSLVKEKYGRTLAIDGDIGLKLFPRIGATVKGLTLSDPGSTRTFAKVGDASVAVAVLPLLSRRVVVHRVSLEGVEANLVRFKDGRTNFDDLLGKTAQGQRKGEDAGKDGDARGAPGAPPAFDIAGVSLRKSAINWRDEAAGRTVRVSDLDLSTGRIASGAPGKLSVRGRVRSDHPAVNAAINLESGYRFDVEKPSVQLSGMDVKLEGDAAGLAGLKAKLSGDIAWAGGNRIEVSSLKLDASAKDGLEARAAVPRLALTPERSESSAIEATLKSSAGARRIDAKLALSAAKSTGPRVDFASAAVDLDLKQDDLVVKGRLASPVSLNLESSQAAFSQLAGNFAVSGPKVPNKSLQLALGGAGQVNWEKKSAQADLTARFDESTAKLKLALADFARPAPQFDLSVDRLNLDRYTGQPQGGQAAAGKPGSGGGKASGSSPPAREEPIDLSALKTLSARGDVRIGSLVAANVKADNVHVGVKAAGGRLDLNPVAARLYEGAAAGSVAVDAAASRFEIRQQLSNVSIGPLLRDAAQKDLLEGRGNVMLNVTTSGNTPTALKRGLNGSASLALRDGAIKGIDLASIARKARALRSGSLEAAAAVKSEKTDFSELNASFTIRNGVAHNQDLSMKSPFIRVGGSGDVDLAAGTLDYTVKASIVATTTGQEGKALEDVRGLTFPVKLSGPFDNMKYSVDARQLVTESVKEDLRRRLEEQVSKGRLGDALKGLLRRPQ